MATVDDAAREKTLREASKTAMRDYAVIPLHFEVAAWAFREGLSYEPRADQHTLAMKVRQAGP
jgi:peptide/nickel transport system substrate-binding protein